MKRICLYLIQVFFLLQVAVAGELDDYLRSKGLVNVAELDTSLRVDLKYATTDNFLNEKVYDGITGVWLHPDAAVKLIKAQQLLKEKYPRYSLIIYDATRPMVVQRKMWNLVKGTDKTNYVSNPANGGGLHNYGLAVDLSIINEKGEALSMGTPFDYFGSAAHINDEEKLLRDKIITRQEYDNRTLLRRIMREAGFSTVIYEWWHFNAVSRTVARESYQLIE